MLGDRQKGPELILLVWLSFPFQCFLCYWSRYSNFKNVSMPVLHLMPQQLLLLDNIDKTASVRPFTLCYIMHGAKINEHNLRLLINL